MYNFDPYNVLLAIAYNIHVLLMTAFVLLGHKYALMDCDRKVENGNECSDLSHCRDTCVGDEQQEN